MQLGIYILAVWPMQIMHDWCTHPSGEIMHSNIYDLCSVGIMHSSICDHAHSSVGTMHASRYIDAMDVTPCLHIEKVRTNHSHSVCLLTHSYLSTLFIQPIYILLTLVE